MLNDGYYMKIFLLLLFFILPFKTIANPEELNTPLSDIKTEHSTKAPLKANNPPKISNTKPDEYYLSYSNACNQTEIQLIENLKSRKQILNEWIQNAEQRELTLKNLEQKIQEKIQLLKGLEVKIEKSLDLYSDQKSKDIKNLVKVYENMKPQEAARIFNDLELADLMIILHSMKTNKVSSILANMNPNKARIITQEIITTDNDLKKFIN